MSQQNLVIQNYFMNILGKFIQVVFAEKISHIISFFHILSINISVQE
jgi:hypothetical protein